MCVTHYDNTQTIHRTEFPFDEDVLLTVQIFLTSDKEFNPFLNLVQIIL